jgi:hypothetical protein
MTGEAVGRVAFVSVIGDSRERARRGGDNAQILRGVVEVRAVHCKCSIATGRGQYFTERPVGVRREVIV